jgi:hypothetical protein
LIFEQQVQGYDHVVDTGRFEGGTLNWELGHWTSKMQISAQLKHGSITFDSRIGDASASNIKMKIHNL